jgi:L-proline amide hydrolase
MPQFYPAREGYASSRGQRTRFRVVGQSQSRWPLLCIHGGPGFGHYYLGALEELSNTGRQVVFYDQLGCGGSDHPEPGFAWSLALFLEEIAAVRAACGLERCHLLGHGWGGILALEYALSRPPGLQGLVLSSTVASVAQWRRELRGLVDALPDELGNPMRATLASGDAAGQAARGLVEAFQRRHLCRLAPWPDCLQRSVAEARARPEARLAMLGANEFAPGGQLADWQVISRLGEIELPTLVLCGRHDLAAPPTAATLYQAIPASEWVVFEHSAHVAHLEEPQRYLEVVDGFLYKAESRTHRPG